ncbi:MAG: hypothetical protein HY542_01210 [Deltaproteobacteria bacterium]|nr:hypothetical protein [Deltaproteobacteria bacterium]
MKEDRRFKDHPYRPEEITGHLEGARKKLKAAYKIADLDEESSYELSYEAMLKASLALILRYGKRPRSQAGHHIAIIEMASSLLGDESADLIRSFDEMRRNRNSFLYGGDLFASDHEVKDALQVAKQYLELVEGKLKDDRPHRHNKVE